MACVTRFQCLRGTTVERVSFTPLQGELVFDTDMNMMFVGDGVTSGGLPFFGETPVSIGILDDDAELSGFDYAIFESAVEVDAQLPDAMTYMKPIRVSNQGDGLLNVLSHSGQLIYGPLGGPATNIQLAKTNSIVFVPKSGRWFLW